jgi:polyisoprenoid-binding protein YceI
LRDRHLRSADFFDTDHHPHVSLRSNGLERQPDGDWRLHGELGAAGKRLALDLTPTVDAAEDYVKIEVETRVDQHRLGMTITRFGIRTPATLTVRIYLFPDPTTARC